MRYDIIRILQLLPVFVGVAVSFANSLQAATMPEYERIQPIATYLYAPTAVAIDRGGNIYVTESGKNRLLVYTPDGEHIKTLFELHKPISVAVDGEGRIFVGNSATGSVDVYNNNLTFLFKLGIEDNEFTQPTAIAVDDVGKVYVADSQEDKIKVYHPDGSSLFSFGSSGTADGQFHFPVSIAIDELSEEIIIADLQVNRSMLGSHEGARIQIFDMNGNFKRSFGQYGATDGKFIKPLGVTVDKLGRLYVSDAYLNVVHVFDNTGVFLGPIYDQENPIRTPLGITLGVYSNKLLIASLRTARVEVYRISDLTIDPFPIPNPSPDISIPEPTTLLLFGTGLIGVFVFGKRIRKYRKSGRR